MLAYLWLRDVLELRLKQINVKRNLDQNLKRALKHLRKDGDALIDTNLLIAIFHNSYYSCLCFSISKDN